MRAFTIAWTEARRSLWVPIELLWRDGTGDRSEYLQHAIERLEIGDAEILVRNLGAPRLLRHLETHQLHANRVWNELSP